MLDFVYVSLQIQGAFFPFSSRGRKSIGRIMMLLSVLLPQLYIHCHQFTTQPLELNPGFYSSALLFICNSCRCGGEWTRVCVCVECVHPFMCVWKAGNGNMKCKLRKLERREKKERRDVRGRQRGITGEVFWGERFRLTFSAHYTATSRNRQKGFGWRGWLVVLLLASLHNDGKSGNVLTPSRR